MIKSRQVSPEMVEAFQLGVAPDAWDALAQFFAARGIDPDRAVEAGLLTERDAGGYYDRFRNRVMFPIRDRDGQVDGPEHRLSPHHRHAWDPCLLGSEPQGTDRRVT